ncbi:3-isopropylmalate dehydrogenase [Fructilactobacillus sp. Tb1]|uniref:3-isopropylmalate dehydrogenase n=1 Tax=Fructilactobacillus sp. Tb1 TaxID=3422304 RepID=UPI003D2BF575
MNKITVLQGDYIGPEIMDAGLQVLAAATENENFSYKLTYAPFGGEAIDKVGVPLPEATIAECKKSDAVLLSAIGGPKWDDAPERPEKGLLKIRQALNLYANIRPTDISQAMQKYSPIKNCADVNFVIVRELTSGIYFGTPRETTAEYALDTMRYTPQEIERVSHVAFKMAQTRDHHVTLVDKSNVLDTSKLWRKIVKEVAVHYPDVKVDFCYVDAMSMKLISNPSQFDVILTENLFGDILSDEAAEITGSLGSIPSMSSGDGQVALYEPIHGSAPDIAGKGIANPFSMINSVKMMMKNSFNRADIAEKIETAVNAAVANGIVTPDLNGTSNTQTVTDYVINEMRK